VPGEHYSRREQLYKVKDVDIIGHSDVAPSRKIDPGKLFPWKRLAKSGASAWYNESDVEYFCSILETAPNDETGKEKLIEYGYYIDKHSKDIKQYKHL
jgi:N-acetyl-anhydromuramyl-L-alanine amidase AmpD